MEGARNRFEEERGIEKTGMTMGMEWGWGSMGVIIIYIVRDVINLSGR